MEDGGDDEIIVIAYMRRTEIGIHDEHGEPT